jgi:type IV secretory pathway VirB10-like protein
MEQVIKDKAPKPAGLVPKNLQAFILVGLALLMVVIMAVTGRRHPVPPTTEATPLLPSLVPVNSQKVTDFQKNIEQTQRESAAQVEAALLQQQRQLASPGNRSGQPYSATPYYSSLPPGADGQAPSDPIRDEKRKRAYFSLFSENVALTYRKELRSDRHSGNSGLATNGLTPRVPTVSDALPTQDPLVAQAQTELAREGQWFAPVQQAGLVPQSPLPAAAQALPRITLPASAPSQHQFEPLEAAPDSAAYKSTLAAAHEGKEYVLFEGTILEALLINRLDGSFAGPVTCLLSDNVYSHDRQHLLIPAGSKIVGEANKVDTFGQARLGVAFHRLIMPDGYSVNLDRFKGLSQEGAAALKDKVNNHYARIFGASVAIGFLGGVAQIGTGSTLTSNSTDRIREGFGVGMANGSEHILDRFLNILPTLTIREGSRVKIYLSNDVLLPDYTTHTMPANL